MLGMIMTILKILGIILCIILVVLLIVSGCILFVPVRYRAEGRFGEKKEIQGKMSWLLFFSLPFSWGESGFSYQWKIFGIHPSRRKNRRKKKKERKIEASKQVKKAQEKPQEKKLSEDRPVLENSSKDSPVKIQETEKNTSKQEAWTEKFTKEKESAGQKKRIIQAGGEKLKNAKEILIDYFCQEEAYQARREALSIMKTAICHIRPQTCKGEIHFGLALPNETGIVYGFLCTFYGTYGENLEIIPDFEQEILEGEVELKGRIRVINCLIYGIKLYKIKKLREFLKLVRNI